MREIKFRAIKESNNDMVFGHLAKHKGKDIIVNDVFQDNGYDFVFSFVKPETVGQYTGLKDKNGIEIYEGDIVKSFYHRDATGQDIIFTKDFIEFELNEFVGKSGFEISFYKNCEIIGNIHENPELLK